VIFIFRRIRKLYRVFGPYAVPYRREITLGYVALGIGVAATALRPWPFKYLLDSVILGETAVDPRLLIVLLCLGLVVIVLIEGTAGYFQKLWFARAGHGATTDVLEQTFTHLQTLPREARASGDLIFRLTSDVKTMRDLLADHQQKLAVYGLTFLVTVSIMATFNWKLTALGLAIVPVIWMVTMQFSRWIRAAAQQKRRREGVVASAVHESLNGLAVIQAFAQEDEERRRFREQARESLEANIESSRLGGAFTRAVAVLNTVGTASVVGLGAMAVLEGQLSPGELVVFAAYMNDLYKPIQNLSDQSARFMDSLVSGERVLEVLETAPRIRDRRTAVRAPRFKGGIVFDHVTFGYGRNTPVVQDLSFQVFPGERVALVGESVSGKSTILHLLLRFFDPWSGRILFDGEDIRKYKLQSLREQIGVVLQDPFLFRRSVFDNIRYGRPRAAPAQVRAAAKAARAHKFIEELPNRYDTMLDELGTNLSGGQRQRIALARAFLRDAPILLMDEPTSGLDMATEADLLKALEELTRGRTTITVAHRASAIQAADRTLLLDNGKIVRAA
jgi:ATP-binding cassette subfamily B protein